MAIDLHTHSTASDGTFSPAEVFHAAASAGLTAVALTDHDTVGGLEEFLAAGVGNQACEAVPGIELACSFYSREIHLVGLFIDYRNCELGCFIRAAQAERERRNRDIMVKLALRGYEIAPGELQEFGLPLSSIGRPHLAAVLVKKYGFTTPQEVFDKLIGRNAPAWVPRRLPAPEAAIKAIHAAGGIAVWAHPVRRTANERAFLRRGCRKLSQQGLDAIEAYYSLFGPAETALVREMASCYHLELSGGSDFHGEHSPEILLGYGAGGLQVPETCLNGLKQKFLQRISRDNLEKDG